MVNCQSCKKDLSQEKEKTLIASICGSIMGDEYIESWYFCKECQAYTLEIYHDRFLGEEDISLKGPIPKTEGDEKVKLIGQCSTPWDKKCRCAAHRSYFGDWLD